MGLPLWACKQRIGVVTLIVTLIVTLCVANREGDSGSINSITRLSSKGSIPMPYANSRGVRIHYELEGQGAPLVLQYGQYFPLDIWYELNYVAALKEHYQLVLVDARGHGDSDKPDDPTAYGLDLMANDIVAVLDHLGIEKTHYMGYSSGALIGFGVLKYSPERLHSLIAGGGHPYNVHAERAAWCADQIQLFERERTEDFVARLEGYIAELQLPPLSGRMRARLLTHEPRALMAWLRQYPAWPSFEDILSQIAVPCLLYIGEHDGLAPMQSAAKAIPDASLVVIPDGGHLEGGTWVSLLRPHITQLLERVDHS